MTLKPEKEPEKEQLDIIRVGTSGSISEDIPVDELVVSSSALGIDNIAHFYKDSAETLNPDILDLPHSVIPYIASASPELESLFEGRMIKGFTLTAPGFYHPQGRFIQRQQRKLVTKKKPNKRFAETG